MMRPPHFFKYYTARVAKIVLSTQRVRWSSPLNFNDPFDCYFSLEPKFDFAEMARKQKRRFFDLLLQDEEPRLEPSNPFSARTSAIRRLVKGACREHLDGILGSAFDDYARGLGSLGTWERERWRKEMADFRLFCVCESNDNLLLWAHYTNSHRGVVFQFECIADVDSPLLEAKPVHYSDEAPALATEEEWIDIALGLRPLTTGEELFRRLVTTKARAWEHEKEWRVVAGRRPDENQGYEDTPICPREISKIFLGCRITETDRADILALLSGPFAHTEAYQARQHPKRYGLKFERIK